MHTYQEPSIMETIISLTQEGKIVPSLYMLGREPKIIPPTGNEPKTVYHYCDKLSFEGIIKSRNIWLSSLFFTNDITEVFHLYNLFDRYKRTLHLNKKDAIKIASLTQLFLLNLEQSFSASFSSLKDDLSQWRGYGDDGEGIAIGFNTKILPITRELPARCYAGFMEETSCAFLEVNYDRQTQLGLIKDIICKVLKNDIPVQNAALFLAKVACVCKNHCFSSESEWRILYTPGLASLEIVNDLKSEKTLGKNFHISKIETRQNNEKTIPFCKYPLVYNLIKEIIIGPKNKMLAEDIKVFLEQQGMINSSSTVNIYKSIIPYR